MKAAKGFVGKNNKAFYDDMQGAKRALGLQPKQSLPRCGHKVHTSINRFEAAGDYSHSDPDHFCEECTCHSVAGKGTAHLGVGWCWLHERSHSKAQNAERVVKMTEAIRAGYPDSVFKYQSNSEVMKKITKEAERSDNILSMRQNMLMLIGMFQQVLTAWETGRKPDGSEFTERAGKDGELVAASDVTMVEVLGKLTERMAKMAKMELEIQDENYVSWEEYTRVLYCMSKLVESKVSSDVWEEIVGEMKKVPQPMRGRKSGK
jgi:hypothetical protein